MNLFMLDGTDPEPAELAEVQFAEATGTDACAELPDTWHTERIQSSFFQLRRSVGGCEKFHGAVIAHVAMRTLAFFREVAQLGAELESFGDRTLGSRN